jgi:hypothetical protein
MNGQTLLPDYSNGQANHFEAAKFNPIKKKKKKKKSPRLDHRIPPISSHPGKFCPSKKPYIKAVFCLVLYCFLPQI